MSEFRFLVGDKSPISLQVDVPVDSDVAGVTSSIDSAIVRVLRPDGTTVEWALTPIIDGPKKFHVIRQFAVGDLTVQGAYKGRVFAYSGSSVVWVSDPFEFAVGPNPIGWPA